MGRKLMRLLAERRRAYLDFCANLRPKLSRSDLQSGRNSSLVIRYGRKELHATIIMYCVSVTIIWTIPMVEAEGTISE